MDKEALSHPKTSKSSKMAVINMLANANKRKEYGQSFCDISRQIFRTNVSIKNKDEEKKRMEEYLITEKEKISDAKIQFSEDCARFDEYINSVNRKDILISE